MEALKMIPAVDAYSYHRYFGFHYPELESAAERPMSMLDFIERARALGAFGVSLESCFFSDFGDSVLTPLKERLDDFGLRRVWAWGHPKGLESGRSDAALEDLIRHIDIAARIGADTMRICAGGRGTRPESWQEQRSLLLPMLSKASEAAAVRGVTLALENHLDLFALELRELMETIDSAHLGVCLDTANNLRMFEDPVEVTRILAPWVRATHMKDVTAYRGNPKSFAFWPSVPLGEGVVDIPGILRILKAIGYDGLLALEIDFLHPKYGSEDEALAAGIETLQRILEAVGANPAFPGRAYAAG